MSAKLNIETFKSGLLARNKITGRYFVKGEGFVALFTYDATPLDAATMAWVRLTYDNAEEVRVAESRRGRKARKECGMKR